MHIPFPFPLPLSSPGNCQEGKSSNLHLLVSVEVMKSAGLKRRVQEVGRHIHGG